MINPSSFQSVSRNPRALVKVNDIVIRKLIEVEYVENNTYVPDTFRVRLPLYTLDNGIPIDYWLSQPAILVNIYMGFPTDPYNYGTGDLENMVVGGIDQLDVHIFENGGVVEFSGRDLTSKFVDNKTTEKYPNKTASEIVTILANKEGLTPVVTSTTTKAGYYYTQDYVQLGSAIPEWDLLTYLAQRENFQVFVRGENLYFQPFPDENAADPYVLQAQTLENGQMASFNGKTLTITRNLNYARDVIVRVRSWNAKTGKVDVSMRATPNKKTVVAAIAQPIGEAQTFEYFYPGLSREQAIVRATNILKKITLWEKVIQTDLPGDDLLRKDDLIELRGVSDSANQTYYPDTITRTISADSGGYSMQVRAKNHSPQSIVLI